MKSREEKERIIRQLKEELDGAGSAFLFDYRGITVGRLNQLRRKIREGGSGYRVVKNTLVAQAVQGTEKEAVAERLEGMTAVAFGAPEPMALARLLADFSRENPTFVFKTGVVEGRVITGPQLKELATLPGREQLLAKVLYMLQAPARRLVTALSGPLGGLAMVLQQIGEKGERAAGS